jgi:hypothetical protein
MLPKVSACWLVLLILSLLTVGLSTGDLSSLTRNALHGRAPLRSRTLPLAALIPPTMTLSPVSSSATRRAEARLPVPARLPISGTGRFNGDDGSTRVLRPPTSRPAILRL